MTRYLGLRRIVPVLCGALVILAFTACTDDGTPELRSGNNQGFVEGEGTLTVFEATDRKPAPELVGTTVQGDDLSLGEFDGDVIVINIWGSWCAPCRSEAPTLQEVAKENAGKGVQFVGINTRDDEVAATAFEESFDITYPSFFDPNGELQLNFTGVVPVEAVPSSLVIDRSGDIAARVVGETSYTQLSRLVRDIKTEDSDPV